jgi:hypothetical protein
MLLIEYRTQCAARQFMRLLLLLGAAAAQLYIT